MLPRHMSFKFDTSSDDQGQSASTRSYEGKFLIKHSKSVCLFSYHLSKYSNLHSSTPHDFAISHENILICSISPMSSYVSSVTAAISTELSEVNYSKVKLSS
jgi:hypothetical protein